MSSVPHANLSRSAIVTGAAQGIGRAIALRLAHDGYDVAVHDLNSKLDDLNVLAEEIMTKGRKAIAVTGDVTQEQDVQTLVDRTVDELGTLHVMVANAGISLLTGIAVDTSLDMWNRTLTTNLTGAFLCYRAAARQMLKQGQGGRIVGASSLCGGRPCTAAYSVSKFGVRGLTQSMASELAKDRITVNAYAPGPIDTPLLRSLDKRFTEPMGKPPGTWLESVADECPQGRIGTPENVAALVSYIVSDEADYMTGQTLSLNGGMFFD